ncbi:MAG: TlpA disulfide reductase family protein [Pseudomonadota bacterium]|nr:TlpA disulfide reductase family protein [Pseudomonadota bacterium]
MHGNNRCRARTRRSLLRGAGLTLLVGVLGIGLGTQAPFAQESERVGLSSLALTDGRTDFDLSTLIETGPVIVHLWATWCAPCLTELPKLAEFADLLSKAGARERFLVVSVDSKPFERVSSFLSARLNLPDLDVLKVQAGNPGSALRVFGYPTTLVLAPSGAVLWRHQGPVDWQSPDRRRDLLRLIGL